MSPGLIQRCGFSARIAKVAIAVVISLIGITAVACTSQSSGSSSATTDPQTSAAQASTSQSDFPVTVTDAGGRTVTISEKPKTVLSVYALKYLLALGLGDEMVNKANGKFELTVASNMADGVEFGKDQMNAETVAQIKPDIFIHKAGSDKMFDTLDQLGVKSIGVHMETPDEVVSTIKLLGTSLGVEDRANELIDYYENLMAVSADKTKDISSSDRPTAILMGNTIGKVANGSMLQSIMIDDAGGTNLAAGIESTGTWPVVGVEQIFTWNPDYIFIMNSTSRDYDVSTVMNDPAWSELNAVKSGHVYVVPSDLDSWEYPSVESALGIVWMTHIMYPDKISDSEFEGHVNDFYQEVYNVSFTREQLNY